jgi:diguanylate cyclase (GGDEF)-like protein
MVNSSAAEEELGGIMVDIDSFKQIMIFNGHCDRRHGVDRGGKILQASFRKDDLISRYGGDEFVCDINDSG